MTLTTPKSELLETYARRLSAKGRTRNQMLRIAGEFLDFAEGNYARETVERFLRNQKEKRHYGPGSLNYVFRLIRTLYGRNDLDWPFNRSEGPVVRESEINAPALSPVAIRKMIVWTKETGNSEMQAFLALSTIYGLRQQEMINLKPEDVRIRDQTIYIATLKHGRERTHIIPDQIVYYLAHFDFEAPRSENHMWNLFGLIEYRAGVKHYPGVSWHANRRTLDTLLLRNFKDPVLVHSFMRWKQATSSDMAVRYSKVTFVGDEETSVEVQGDALSVDMRIFTEKNEDGTLKHPFLDCWE